MKILKTEWWDTDEQSRADEAMIYYQFCFEIMSSAYQEVEYSQHFFDIPRKTDFQTYSKPLLQQIECHLITSGMMLFNDTLYSSLHYVKPISIEDFYFHIYVERSNTLFRDNIKSIMKDEKLNHHSSQLSKNENLIIIFCKSIIHYGLINHHVKMGFYDSDFQDNAYRFNKLYHIKVIRDIKTNYHLYTKDSNNNDNENSIGIPRISFYSDTAKKQAILYFYTLGKKILLEGLFTDVQMLNTFIESLMNSKLEEGKIFIFNDKYNKKLIIHLFELAKKLFANNRRNGQFYFIKNTNQFKYLNTTIRGNNWLIENIISNSVDHKILEAAELEFNKIKGLAKFEVDNLYSSTNFFT